MAVDMDDLGELTGHRECEVNVVNAAVAQGWEEVSDFL